MTTRRGLLDGLRALSLLAIAGGAWSGSGRAAELFGPEEPFASDMVVNLARERARRPFAEERVVLPEALQNLTYDQYRDIRFDPTKSIWRGAPHGFSFDLFHTGFFYTTPVDVHVVSAGRQARVNYLPELFSFGPSVTRPAELGNLPFAGFRLRYPINTRDFFDEFCVFQGASYFRAVAKGQVYGLSARGLAIDTGQPQGEEFPFFRAFWIEEPLENAATLRVHALLDSPSATGAYVFTISPGEPTRMDVEMTLFPRRDLEHAGIAPLTSMFLYDAMNRARFDDFRSAVHDSDGLMMLTGAGEWLWRPLHNPTSLQVSAFVDVDPKGFGLMQRKRHYVDFADLEARYERRPSLWVEPFGAWGEGFVELFEIPTRGEYNDNIVAFWRPKRPIPAGSAFTAAYRLTWCNEWPLQPPKDKALVRFSGSGLTLSQDRRLFVIDFQGENLAGDVAAEVTASAGLIANVVLHQNAAIGGLRLSFEFDPAGAELSELRAVLRRTGERLSETWLYRWTRP